MCRMLVALIIGAALSMASGAAAQDSGYSYDWPSGSGYNWYTDSQGNTSVYGNNLHTGSNWSTRIDQRGNMNGFDSGGNYWTYNRSTGSYSNFGTGKICFGSGTLRTCY